MLFLLKFAFFELKERKANASSYKNKKIPHDFNGMVQRKVIFFERFS